MGKYDLDYSSWQQLTIAILENIPEGIADEKRIIKDLTEYPQKQTNKMAMDDFRSLKQKLKKTAMIPALRNSITDFLCLFKTHCVGSGSIDIEFSAMFPQNPNVRESHPSAQTNFQNNKQEREKMSNQEKNVLGIDLGTTYSCVAVIDEFGQPRVLQNFEGRNTTPSVVSFEDDANDSALVGDAAKNLWKAATDRTVVCIKRHMTNDESFNKPTKFPLNWDPCELSAQILKKLVLDANTKLAREDNPVKDVVITCPAYFDTKARARTKQAGEMAGLNVLHVINEPTAAALAYGVKQEEDKTILVYDLGGGTFDVTILKITGNEYEVIATGGDPLLGGYDWDKEIANKILSTYNEQYNTDFVMPMTEDAALNAEPKIQRMRASLLLEAERVKIALTASKKGSTKSAWLFEEDGHSLNPVLEISREDFDNMTIDLLDSTIEKVQEVLEAAKNKGVTKIDQWLLVGGSSKMPQVKQRVDQDFGCDACLVDPDECVAKGAAIYGASIKNTEAGDKTGLICYDVSSKTYGTDVTHNGQKAVENLIFRNEKLPAECTASFCTVTDNQRAVSVEIYESDSDEKIIEPGWAELVNQNNRLTIKTDLPKGSEIKIKFYIDNTGMMHVTASAADGSLLEFDQAIKGLKNETEMKASMEKIEKASANL